MTLTLEGRDLARFRALLQRGVAVRVAAGRTVLDFLVQDLGLTPEYVRQRITTVFLDGQVVDSLGEAVLRRGARLALSAAMPGLVGATLRRSGPYAAMRAAITRPAEHEAQPGAGAPEVVQVKLFNLVIDEVGPALLEHGVLLERAEAASVGLMAAASEGTGDLVDVRVRFR